MYQKILKCKIRFGGFKLTMSSTGVIDVEVVGEALATKDITNNNVGDDEVLRTPDSGYSSISTPSSRLIHHLIFDNDKIVNFIGT